jgi:hypothetical protein
VVRRGLAGASLGAGAIHASAVSDHTEHSAQLVFFIAVAALQVGWALAVWRRASWPLLAGGAALNFVVMVVWILSRTVGLSGVPGAEHAQPLGLKDGVATVLELVLVAGVGSLIPEAGRRLRLASGAMASWVTIASIGTLTAAGLAAPGHHHDEKGHADEGTGLAASGPHRERDGRSHETGDLVAAENHDEAPAHTNEDPAAASHGHNGPGHENHHAVAGHTHEGEDHGAPGHVHIPGHVHSGSGPHDQHEAAHDHPGPTGAAAPHEGAEHDHPSGPEAGRDHDHDAGPGHDQGEGGGHDHGGGGGHDHCNEEGPENPVVTQVREAVQALGLGCIRQ